MHYLINESDPRTFVTCQLCGKKFRRIYWDHFNYFHGVTEDEYKTIFPGPTTCDELRGDRSVDESNPDSYIKCQLCGRKFRLIAWAHTYYTHGITLEEYMDLFPGPTKCVDALGLYVESMHITMSDPEVLAARNEAISLAHQTRVISDEEHDKRVVDGKRTGPMLWEKLDKDPEAREAYFEKRGNACRESEYYQETHAAILDEVRPTLEEQSRIMTELIKDGTITPQYRSLPTDYDGITFRSRLEAKFAEAFDGLLWDWEYEPEILTLEDGKSYLPDFRVEELGGFVEIKAYDDGWNTRKANEVGAKVLLPEDLRDLQARVELVA